MDIPLPLLGSFFEVRRTEIGILAGASRNNVILHDPNRWAIIFGQPTIGTVQIFSDLNGANPDWTQTTTAQPIMWYFSQVGQYIQQAFGFTNPGGVATVFPVIEILYKPPPTTGAE